MFKDLFSILKKNVIIFDHLIDQGNDQFTFVFKTDKKIDWHAGQHALFSIAHKKIKKATRPFSVASAPSDNTVEFTTRIVKDSTEFKKTLLELKPGDKMLLRGPFGGFYLKNSKPILLIAAGIGITPIKSMLNEIHSGSGHVPTQTKLLYIDSSENFVYKDNLDKLIGSNGIKINYLNSRVDLHESISDYVKEYGNDSNYFIAGSPQMTKDVTNRLKEQGVKGSNIIKDSFFGV